MSGDFQLTARLKKEFASLDEVKGRRKSGLFVAEGTKCILQLLPGFTVKYLFALEEWLEEHGRDIEAEYKVCVNKATLRELTRLSTTPPAIAFFNLPEAKTTPEQLGDELVLALDRVQDPGNLGTILRTADWFGVKTVVCSIDTVDCFNPKTVQATMGALANLNIVYLDLAQWLGSLEHTPVYGTFLDGENIYRSELPQRAVIVMGNEGRGIGAEVEKEVTHRVLIPSFDSGCVESLNVGVATGVVLSLFRAKS